LSNNTTKPKGLLLSSLLCWAEKVFVKSNLCFGHGTTTAWDEAVSVASYVLNLNLYIDPLKNINLTRKQINLFIKIVTLRARTKQPLAYITKTAWFANKQYYVDQRVIIPRSPFAELINNKFKPWVKIVPNSILDLCTGSGCIALACFYAFSTIKPNIKIDGSDKSHKALKVAIKNSKLHNLENKVKFIQSNLFDNIPLYQYDLIVSNPPYVDQRTFEKLPKEFHFEPKMALLSGKHGLEIVVNILKTASKFLSKRGILIIEVGYIWKQLIKLYPKVNFTWITLNNGGEGIFLLTKKQLDYYFIKEEHQLLEQPQ
jgi:ribosomal protein L3 glutamine methyltransferase